MRAVAGCRIRYNASDEKAARKRVGREYMDECKISGNTEGAAFDELVVAMQDDLYWVRFFARPCCPAPDLEGAAGMLDHLKRDVEARSDFTAQQKQQLCDTIEARKEWYAGSGLCRTSRR